MAAAAGVVAAVLAALELAGPGGPGSEARQLAADGALLLALLPLLTR